MTAVGHVAAIWRHPVKSFGGEALEVAAVEADGLRGDRQWGVGDAGRILTGRREPQLLQASARLEDDGRPSIALPDGTTVTGTGPAADAVLSAWLGRPVSLVAAAGAPGGRAEYFADATDDTSAAIEWTMPSGRFVDALPLLVLTTASLRTGAALHPNGVWDVRRFRPNVLVDVDAEGWVEDEWCGRPLRIGEVEVVPQQPCERCTMVTRPQPGLERDLDVYRTVARHHEGRFGVWAQVRTTGVVRVGDAVERGDS